MSKLLTHGLENSVFLDEMVNKALSKYTPETYSYNEFKTIYQTLESELCSSKIFPKIPPNEINKIFNRHDLYIDVLTYHVISKYTQYKVNNDLPYYCYVYILLIRPYMYNVIMCMRTNNEIIEFKKQLLEEVHTLLINNSSKEILHLQELLTTDEFFEYQYKSALQQFKYFVDVIFINDPEILKKPNTSYVIVHLSYNNMYPQSLYTTINLAKTRNIFLTEDYLTKLKIFDNNIIVFPRHDMIEIVDHEFNTCELSNNNIFVISYDNARELSECTLLVCHFVGKQLTLSKEEAERKINGELYKSIDIDKLIDNFTISNAIKYYDEPEQYDKMLPIKFQAFLTKIFNECSSYKTFYKVMSTNNAIYEFFNNDELQYFLLYMRGYDNDYDKIKILDYAMSFYKFDE